MPPNLQGLNIVLPPQAQSDAHDLLSVQSYPDLAAQLDLWTNLTFDSDEPLGSRDEDKYRRKSLEIEDDLEGTRSPVTREKATHDGHVNVVTGTNLGSNQPAQHTTAHPSHQAFDLNAFLSGFGIDPFAVPPVHQQPAASTAPSLAQILALHANQTPGFHTAPTHLMPPYSATTRDRGSFARPAAPASVSDDGYPTAKRSRTRKASISSLNSPDEYREDTSSAGGNPLTASEDKRRRNTAASARFRLKKKEREAALEGKAKELETRVNELERECEGLRRENGWLKGLVVGVTGAAQGPVVAAPPAAVGMPTSGSKRRRDADSV
ncbi:hypothetical protein K443DRAFT_671152 [Laccaria amethystina LaAM-08-1]|uniref:BZIP domain-containing protein n=1 Tax=Laccaria amethystina LaAM-08-1 TaxID=1095629 RepID=A0A0C9YHK2_9AGAR|nr:hypothetical protein K443DRAFT_671152 [Laccaria amethystina LaAM-08-1]